MVASARFNGAYFMAVMYATSKNHRSVAHYSIEPVAILE